MPRRLFASIPRARVKDDFTMKAGLDFGSKHIHLALLNGKTLVFTHTEPHHGRLADALAIGIKKMEACAASGEIHHFGITGNLRTERYPVTDSVIASVEANHYLDTGCRNIFSIGCENFYLVHLDERFHYQEHVVNSDCASGTGGFIDQQAERLGFSTPDLGEKAFAYTQTPPSIATRCAVFAKSDIIHAQAKGFSKDAVCAGICEGVARNILANTVRGRQLEGDVLFVGGMSQNPKIVEQLSKGLKTKVHVPDQNLAFNAIGAACLADIPYADIQAVLNDTQTRAGARPVLDIGLKDYPDFSQDRQWCDRGIEITAYQTLEKPFYEIYLGIDVGSTSTKAVAMDRDGIILAGLYGRTKGDPVKAVSTLFSCLNTLFSKSAFSVIGVGTTGSGRDLICQVIQADEAINEITAHALGATFLDPEVDTIIEIGGQDSKFTRMTNGQVTHAAMNYVCTAGTGSFIEEQAKRLSLPLDAISTLADGQAAPYSSDRCTVYMERDLNLFLSEGWTKEQIITAVLYSVRDNYLSKVVGKSRMGNRIYFQGATARNKALVAVFEDALQKPVSVSKYCHLTGALGCAVSLKQQGKTHSRFTDTHFTYDTHTETCDLCANQCELRVYTTHDTRTAWGLKCGRDYDDRSAKTSASRARIQKTFETVFGPTTPNPEKADLCIGIPDILFMKEYTGMFTTFFQRLGIRTVIEKSSSKKLTTGMAMINADFCAPMALAHGVIESLAHKKADLIFFPTWINEQNLVEKRSREECFSEKSTDAYFCYYSAYAPDIINNLPAFDFDIPMVSPKLKLNNQPDPVVANELARQLTDIINRPVHQIEEAYMQARNRFYHSQKVWQETGQKILDSAGRLTIMLLGRPYALFDNRMNLGIPEKLEDLGYPLINQSMVDPGSTGSGTMDTMHWFFGQQILAAAEYAIDHPDVYPVFLTCFRCSPDAYLITYFKEMMEQSGKPYLVLQLDEHSSDVGYMTRIEAGLDAFENDFKKQARNDRTPRFNPSISPDRFQPEDTILIPATDERINRFQQAVFQTAGYHAHILPMDTRIMNQGYRYASGGECLPNVAITGSVIHALQTQDIHPEKSILYLPNICFSCNFNQYAGLVKTACRNAGFPGMRVMNFNGLAAVPDVGAKTNAHLLSITILGSILEKLKRRYQPYETIAGKTRERVNASEQIVIEHILHKKSLLTAAKEIKTIFEPAALPDSRKPVIAVLGDMYAKFNAVLNDHVCDEIEHLGGEVLMPSYNELVLHAMHADIIENNQDDKLLKTMTRYEKRFESIFADLLKDRCEPSLDDCHRLTTQFGLRNFIAGETAISVGRLLWYIDQGLVDGVIHVNPLLCCPGVISASIFKNIQNQYKLPIIDLFYDGTNKPNAMIKPLMFYLSK